MNDKNIINKAVLSNTKASTTEPQKRKIIFGGLKGKIHVPNDFDEPLPDNLLDLFEGKKERTL